jgi:peptide/nickel transport system substrate-binding protein
MAVPEDPAARRQIEFSRRQFERLGFRVRLRPLRAQRLFEECSTPRARIHVCPFGWYRDFPDAQSVLDPLFNGRSILPQGNTNLSQLDVPAINEAIEAAKGLADPAQRAAAWAAIDRRIVEEAPAVPLAWPRVANIRSRDVAGVVNTSLGVWDYSATALR